MQPTGIPPHVHLYQKQQESHTAQLPEILLSGFEKLLAEKCVGGGGIPRRDLHTTIQSLL
jgi:hypothetical protein